MQILENPHRGIGLDVGAPLPFSDPAPVLALLARCPVHAETPLVAATGLAARAGITALHVKDERGRMGLGSFKALGAAHVIACDAAAGPLAGVTYVTASAGNHGLSVAAGARVFGAGSVVYLSQAVPSVFADRLAAQGAWVIVEGADYAASMQAAADAADRNGWRLLSDSSWPGYMDAPHLLMQGYLALASEAANRMPEPPTQILLQAGVGGLAGACAALFRARWGDGPRITVVEPDFAPALQASIRAGHAVAADGPESCMGRLDCKEPSLIALAGLSRDADAFATITEAEAQSALPILAAERLATTASGGAGLAAVLAGMPLTATDRVLAILSEEPEA